jgi:glycerol-3-phosphate acyltransferase PlsY
MIGVAAVIAALAIYKHRTNIQRLMDGTENRFGKKPEAGS